MLPKSAPASASVMDFMLSWMSLRIQGTVNSRQLAIAGESPGKNIEVPRVASSPCTPFNDALNGAPFNSDPSGITRVWQPLQSERPSDSPLDVGTHRKPNTL